MSIAASFRFALFLAAVFAVKLVVVLPLDKHPLVQPDAGLDTTAGLYYVSPLYIYFLALIYGLTESFTAVRIMQASPRLEIGSRRGGRPSTVPSFRAEFEGPPERAAEGLRR